MSVLFKKRTVIIIGLVNILVWGCAMSKAQERKPNAEEETFELTIDSIMEGPALTGTPPSNLMWSRDSKILYFNWLKPGEKVPAWYALDMKTRVPRKTSADDILKNPPVPIQSAAAYRSPLRSLGISFLYDKSGKRALVVRNGDISLMSFPSGRIKRLTATDERETGVQFNFNQDKIFYTFQDNLFLLSLKDYSLRQMTSFTRKPVPPRKKPDEITKWFQAQQRELFEEFRKRQRPSTPRLTFPGLDETSRRKPYHLPEDQYVMGLELSPDEKYVYFRLSERSPDRQNTIVPNYVTRSGYTETLDAHAKAAYSYPPAQAGIMDVSKGTVTWVEYELGEKTISPSGLYWSPDGKSCVLTARSQDRKDVWLLQLDITTGKTTIMEHVHDEAWIGYLGLTNVVWMPDSQHLSYISEKDGYAHLYRIALDSKEITQLTKGRFEVYSAALSRNGKKWHLTSNEEHPGERHFYSMSLSGGSRTKITSLTGRHETVLSPDETALAILFSTTNHPAELYLQPHKPKAKAERITLSTSKKFQSHTWYVPEIVTFTARDGVEVYARLFRPEQWHPEKPTVIFIHGAGYLQNAHLGWSSYSREYMFHNFLIHHGYLVLDVDYRGSAGYGRDCRTGIYRHMGGKDLDDIVDGAKYLVSEHGANPQRIGTYGGSYGGFLTFMAMFTAPDVFAAGAALRPVTDWAHYHNSYTANILNLPHEDSQAYEQSSPIYFAEGLKGALLICHGMVDTNVHFQDSVRLVQRLIELRKENWELAVYPVEGHSFRNPSSWADEYKRIFKLFENNLK